MENYIQKTISELRKLEELKTEVDREIKDKQDVLKRYMIIHNLDELHGLNGEKVCYREVISKRFDAKSFKEKFGELYDLYLKNTKNLRFYFSY